MADINAVSNPEEPIPSDMKEDRISILPWHVLSIILSFLPILDAVKTSILSKDWRFRWLSLSEFSLDSNMISFKDSNDSQRWELISGIVNKYLSDHTSPITKFYVRTDIINSNCEELCQWIGYLSTQNVEVFSLQCRMALLPSALFSFKKLKKLVLRGCALLFSSDFKGLNSLHTLYIRDAFVDGDVLNRLIYSCPNLEKLTLLNIYGITLLRIHAPRLTVLYLDTGVKDIDIEVASCLATVIIADVTDHVFWLSFNSHGVTRRLLGLDSIKELGISGYMIKHLAANYGVGDFQWKNSTLTTLGFHRINFNAVEMFHICLSLMISCPNVHRLYFILASAKGPKLITNFVKEHQGRFCFPQLTSLEMKCPKGAGMGCTVQFLEFIGAHSPNIKFITVVREGKNTTNRSRVLQMLTGLRKHCPQATVRYVHYDHPDTRCRRITYQ